MNQVQGHKESMDQLNCAGSALAVSTSAAQVYDEKTTDSGYMRAQVSHLLVQEIL